MHRNIARAYDYLKREHDRIRAAYVKILAQNDRSLERHIFGADLDSPRHHDEMLLYEERLSRPQLLGSLPPVFLLCNAIQGMPQQTERQQTALESDASGIYMTNRMNFVLRPAWQAHRKENTQKCQS
jgi:hypothetical protein